MSFEEITQKLGILVEAETAEAKRAVDSLFQSFTSLAKVTEEAQKKSKAFGSALGGGLFDKTPTKFKEIANSLGEVGNQANKAGGFFEKAGKKWASDLTNLALKVGGVGLAFKLAGDYFRGAFERAKVDPALEGLDRLAVKSVQWTKQWEKAIDSILGKIATAAANMVDASDAAARGNARSVKAAAEFRRRTGRTLTTAEGLASRAVAGDPATGGFLLNVMGSQYDTMAWAMGGTSAGDQQTYDEIRHDIEIKDAVSGNALATMHLLNSLVNARLAKKKGKPDRRTSGHAIWSDLDTMFSGAGDVVKTGWNTMGLYGAIADTKAGMAETANRNATGLDFLLGGAAGGTEPSGFSTTAGQASVTGIGPILDKALEKLNEVSLASQTFYGVMSAGLNAGIEALISGQEGAGKAALRASAMVIRGLSAEFSIRAMGAFVGGNIPQGLGYTAASAAAMAASAGLLALAGGGGGGGPQVPASAGGYGGSSTAPGGGPPPSWFSSGSSGGGGETINLYIGDGFVGKPAELAAEIEETLRAGKRSGRIKSTPGAVTWAS